MMTHKSPFQYAGETLLNLLAPQRCMRCLREGNWLCWPCRQKVVPFRQRCIVCAEEKPSGATCSICSTQTSLTGIVSAGAYHSAWLRRGIGWLKFKGVKSVAPTLASLLAPELTKIAPPDQLAQSAVLVPVPLHQQRLSERGFNQSELIAQTISQFTNIPVVNLLVRPKSTFIQTRLPHELRGQNTKEAFLATQAVPAGIRFIILVDDVVTTGSTLSAAASAISINNDQQIWAVTIARG